ncbi:lipoate--protein ligase family protein [Amycolatopsis sp. PS_44_ISF1]|uniref:lipoate--protein ligase family protein n=1 Tax=Amycolatopsis sp. PS_44_ISF1 TaxID=2974917 RepID=UPI0028DDD812|nr:lipoate--protein ligase family protein [Amycolatopsis sp. PS_44_ISF1]MDT8915390.1 lipoate--protein ligase family protein [Amycolatopsis sp. PS_44_ISF1]
MNAGSDVRAEFADPAGNLAFDEALLRVGPPAPVLWLWRNPVCVVLGRGQKAAREVRVPDCVRDGVPVLRRASGGGTVFHDPGNLNVTLVLPGPADRPLEMLGRVMSAAVEKLGLPPILGERGLFVGTRKLCGFAVFRAKGGLLAHSTLLVDTDPSRVGAYLTGPPPDPKPLDSHRSPVASLADHGLAFGAGEVESVVRAAAASLLGPLEPRAASPAELERQQTLLYTRYHYDAWHADGRQRQP